MHQYSLMRFAELKILASLSLFKPKSVPEVSVSLPSWGNRCINCVARQAESLHSLSASSSTAAAENPSLLKLM